MSEDQSDLYFFENKILGQGYDAIIGIDEVGRGPLAGPVVASAVVMPIGLTINDLDDSKKLSHKRRLAVFELLKNHPDIIYSISEVSSQVIDSINILRASHLAMKQAATKIVVSNPYILVDGLPVPNLPYPSLNIIKGDSKSASIAAASIVAKVYRDDLMVAYDKQYPRYRFAEHKGYGTKKHLEMLAKFGPCPIHRQSFSPVANSIKKCSVQGMLPNL